jgi:tRNA(fMet)-specific endonuclease VapC
VGTVIDSSVVIAAERGLLDFDLIFSPRRAGEPLVLSAVTASELLHGVHRAKTSAQRHDRDTLVERVLRTLTVVAFDLSVARVHARIGAQLSAKGINIGERDLMIAATAMSLGYRVATRDKGSFPRISGLAVEIW